MAENITLMIHVRYGIITCPSVYTAFVCTLQLTGRVLTDCDVLLWQMLVDEY